MSNRTSVVETNGDRVTWTYDDTYQLTREQRSGANAYDTKFTYDALGTRELRQHFDHAVHRKGDPQFKFGQMEHIQQCRSENTGKHKRQKEDRFACHNECEDRDGSTNRR